MADLLVRDLTDGTLERLAKRAEASGTSLQVEVRRILENEAQLSPEDILRRFAEWDARASMAGPDIDVVDLVRKDRERA